MNIKFKLVPKVTPAVLPETAKIIKQAEETTVLQKETKTLEELLYGKEVPIDDIITD